MSEVQQLVDSIIKQFGNLDPLATPAVSSVERYQKKKLHGFLTALIDSVVKENQLVLVREDEIADLRIACERTKSTAWIGTERLLDAITVRDNLLQDMRQDNAAYQHGHADCQAQMRAALTRMAHEHGTNTSLDAGFWIERIMQRLGLETDKAMELAPPDAIRNENLRLVRVLHKALETLNYHPGQEIENAVDDLVNQLEEALNLSIPF